MPRYATSRSRMARAGRWGVRFASSCGPRSSTSRRVSKRAAWCGPQTRPRSRRFLRADARSAPARSVTVMRMRYLLVLLLAGVVQAQSADDSDVAAYTPATLATVLGGTARSQNDEAELVGPHEWYSTSATFTGHKRPPSGRYRPLIGAWLSSRGQDESGADTYFGGELPELEFEQGGRRYWVMAGLPGGLGFDVYPPGQKLTIYLQRVGFASGVAGAGVA